jgi:hypothetical protein
MSQNNIPVLTLPVLSTGNILAKTFVTYAGLQCGAAGRALGVARANSDFIGQPVATDVIGTTQVLTGAAVNQGDKLQSDANGNAITQTGTNPVLAVALEAATGAGQTIEVLLVPGS